MTNKVYIAAPFFNELQINIVESIKLSLDMLKVDYFSPKDECLYDPKTMTPEEVFKINEQAMSTSNMMVVVTDGKDPGTLFEAGWAHAKEIPIIYCWFSGQPGQKFNLVLAATGSVVRDFEELDAAIAHWLMNGKFVRKNWSDSKVMYYE